MQDSGVSHDAAFAHFVRNGRGAYVGRHLILDMWGVENHASEELILRTFEEACRDIGAQVLFSHVHPFGPDCGTTGVVVLAESHLTWHHYPEANFIAIDVFVCGRLSPEGAVPRLRDFWKATQVNFQEFRRGEVADRAAYVASLAASASRRAA